MNGMFNFIEVKGGSIMELRNLITFSKIAHLKSFSKAAETLGYAQSTITTQIQLLEQELGTKLFERIGRSIELTKNGEVFLDYVEKIINLSNEAKEAISESDAPKGILRIGIVESLCTIRLPELLKNYRMKYPEVEVVIKLGTCTDLRNMLKNNMVDLALILGESVNDSDLVSSMSYEEPMALLASPVNKLANKKEITIRDIADESLILTEKGCSYRNAFEKMFHKVGLQPHVALEVGSIETIKTFAMSNLGITLLPVMTVKKELDQKQLIALDWVGEEFNMMTQMLYHKNKWMTPSMKAFIAELHSDFSTLGR